MTLLLPQLLDLLDIFKSLPSTLKAFFSFQRIRGNCGAQPVDRCQSRKVLELETLPMEDIVSAGAAETSRTCLSQCQYNYSRSLERDIMITLSILA